MVVNFNNQQYPVKEGNITNRLIYQLIISIGPIHIQIDKLLTTICSQYLFANNIKLSNEKLLDHAQFTGNVASLAQNKVMNNLERIVIQEINKIMENCKININIIIFGISIAKIYIICFYFFYFCHYTIKQMRINIIIVLSVYLYYFVCFACYIIITRTQIQSDSFMILYIIQGICMFIFTIALVWYFSHNTTPYYVRTLVILAFTLSFICFLILPMDIYETSQTGQEQPPIILTWIIVYDLNFFFCWLVLPIVQEFEDSGQFSTIAKIKEALRTNAIMMLLILVGAVVLVIYLVIVGRFTIGQLPSVFATIVNGFGMFLVSVMLGFGLVSFPKENFMKVDYKKRVNRCHKMAQMLKSEQQTIKQQVYQISRILQIRKSSPQSDQHQTQILYLIQQSMDFTNFRSYADPNQNLLKKTNPSLHTVVKKRIIQYNACESQLDQLVDQLRDISVSFTNNSYKWNKILYAVLFAITLIISLLIFIAEISTFIEFFGYINVLSLINWSSPASYIMNCLLTFYIAYIVTHTVFRIKLYKVFSLHKKHSSSSSLIFTSINLARVCFPLCYNYLQITHIKHASFLIFFGQMNFNTRFVFIFPLVMVIFAIFNVFDIYDTIMGYLGLGSYAFDEDDEKEKTQEGRKILAERLKERNIQNHKMEMIQLL